jgi:hypothetical protein
MPLLPHDAFLQQLTSLFKAQQERATGKGSIYVWQKQALSKGKTGNPVCFYRVSDGRMKKFSTQVGPGDSATFHPLLMSILKVSDPLSASPLLPRTGVLWQSITPLSTAFSLGAPPFSTPTPPFLDLHDCT